ncbi:N-glycosidase YbiA-like [Mytilus edulis]|uniref:N-glycosidase YbiA-like n=1 Tax=Mytilus edulis TaxID=6550 RepID=UPI0039EDFB4D
MKTEILKETDPAKIKRLGRRVQIDATEWERVSYDITKRGIWAKFSSDRLRRYLQATHRKILAESSPTDLKWGTGYAITDPNAYHQKMWRGQNLLGQALMEVREDLMMKDRVSIRSTSTSFITYHNI